MLSYGQFHKNRTEIETMNNECRHKCEKTKRTAQRDAYLNLYSILIIILLVQSVNSNTTNMNRRNTDRSVDKRDYSQSHSPNDDYDERDNTPNFPGQFEQNPYYNSEDFLQPHGKFYSEDNSYSNYGDYKRYYLNPSNPIPKSNVKFKISSRIVQTKYGKLQGIVLAMDEHRYLSPLEVFLGVPYATPPVGSNRFSPTRTPSPWDGVRVSDRPGPACPQKLPDLDDERTILEKMPKGRLEYLKRLMPYLKNQDDFALMFITCTD